ncbi:hypothetical protein AcV5_001812 [Taiwanofungus camphoratus]|nr:hypothetical protein AcV5_001812 [Antrodia cinnamomea]
MSYTTDPDKLDALFPLPSPAPSLLCPARFPGISHASKVAVAEALKENHQTRFAFITDDGLHNHTSHQLLAVYAMGAPASLMNPILRLHDVRTEPARPSPGDIRDDNFYDHLGDRSYYFSYLQYFISVLLEKGAAATIEEYVFSPKANIEGSGVPRYMLNRVFARLVHPMIHIGYGLEFGMLGLVAEGLAQTAVHPLECSELVPSSLFTSKAAARDAADAAVSHLTSLFPSLALGKVQNGGESVDGLRRTTPGVHAFTILARMSCDERFTAASIGLPVNVRPQDVPTLLDRVTARLGETLLAYAGEWYADGHTVEEVASKVEELSWLNTLLYGVGGWAGRKHSAGGKFVADFFLMHLVTSSLFLPSFAAYLSPSSTGLLLRTYFAISLTWWVVRGRPALPIREFYESVSPTPSEPGAPHNQAAKETLIPENVSPNPWLPIIQTTIVHPDDHLCKIQRAFAHYASVYGGRPVGYFAGLAEVEGTPLEGVDMLDGTLFVRVAGLTADRMRWASEGQDTTFWDMTPFFA